jgi:hypothetical protein
MEGAVAALLNATTPSTFLVVRQFADVVGQRFLSATGLLADKSVCLKKLAHISLSLKV